MGTKVLPINLPTPSPVLTQRDKTVCARNRVVEPAALQSGDAVEVYGRPSAAGLRAENPEAVARQGVAAGSSGAPTSPARLPDAEPCERQPHCGRVARVAAGRAALGAHRRAQFAFGIVADVALPQQQRGIVRRIEKISQRIVTLARPDTEN